MNPKELILSYFKKVNEKKDWEAYLSNDIQFSSPMQNSLGKQEYVTAAGRFFQMVQSLEIKKLIIEGDTACAWVEYSLLRNGKTGECLVAELLKVNDEKIVSLSILFDTLALKSFTTNAL